MLSIIATLYLSITAISAGLTGSQKTTLLNHHNNFRRKVAAGNQNGRGGKYPKGRLPDLRWDNTLAKLAQGWADKCGNPQATHNNKRGAQYKKIYDANPSAARLTYKYDGVGENVAGNCLINKGVHRFAEQESAWWAYSNSWGSQTCKKGATSSNNPVCTHLTQIIWADTQYVGCGWNKCDSWCKDCGKLVCNYYTGGNSRGSYPYKCSTPGQRGCPEKLTGPCCADNCFNNPSKANCDTQCENAVKRADNWCGSNKWDKNCEMGAKRACNQANAFKTECAFDRNAVCMDGSHGTRQFEVDADSDCNDEGYTLYRYTSFVDDTEEVVYANYYLKPFEDLRESQSGWMITEELQESNVNISWWAEEKTIAKCYKDDLMACIESEWSEDSSMTAYQCPIEEAKAEQSVSSGSGAVYGIIAALFVMAICGILIGAFCWNKTKGQKKRKWDEEVKDEDDIMKGEEVIDGDQETETIEVEFDVNREALVETQ